MTDIAIPNSSITCYDKRGSETKRYVTSYVELGSMALYVGLSSDTFVNDMLDLLSKPQPRKFNSETNLIVSFNLNMMGESKEVIFNDDIVLSLSSLGCLAYGAITKGVSINVYYVDTVMDYLKEHSLCKV